MAARAPSVTQAPANTIKISPSDLSFALDECQRCLWRKIVQGERKPRQPMPSIFTAIDGGMKTFYNGAGPEVVPCDGFPAGKFDLDRTEVVCSAPLANLGFAYPKFVISGKMDTLYRCADGTVGVVDFKTSRVKPEYIAKYGRQLHAYGWCLEHPGSGPADPMVVSRMGLLSWALNREEEAVSPPTGIPAKDCLALYGTPAWHEVVINWFEFRETMIRLCYMLLGSEPAPSPGCEWCAWKRT